MVLNCVAKALVSVSTEGLCGSFDGTIKSVLVNYAGIG